MIEFTYDERGEIYVEEYEQMLNDYGPDSECALASALKSTGYYLKEKMQAAVRAQGEPAGSWAPRNLQGQWLTKGSGQYRHPIKNWKSVWRGKKGQRRRGRQYWSEQPTIQRGIRQTWRNARALLRLAQGIRYKWDNDLKMMSVGFVNPQTKFKKFLEHQAAGYTTRITARMRRFAFAMGMPISKHKHFFRTPPRPLVGPVWEAEKETALARLEEKFFGALTRYQDMKRAA